MAAPSRSASRLSPVSSNVLTLSTETRRRSPSSTSAATSTCPRSPSSTPSSSRRSSRSSSWSSSPSARSSTHPRCARSSGRNAASRAPAASSRSSRLPTGAPRARGRDARPVRAGLGNARGGRHLICLRPARCARERHFDARVELHHVVEQRQLEDSAHVRVVDDDPELRPLRARPPRRAEQDARASSSR